MNIQKMYRLVRGCNIVTFEGPCRECGRSTIVRIVKTEVKGISLSGGTLAEAADGLQRSGVYVICQPCLEKFSEGKL